MKRIICTIICIISLLCVFCGCQKTPEEPIVIGKDQSAMIEKAQEKQEPLTEIKQEEETLPAEIENREEEQKLRTKLGIPERYEETIDGKIKLVIDAEIKLPNQSNFPIARVQGVNFTQEQVTAFYDALCGDAEMYPSVQTKEDIEQRIVETQRDISKAESEGDENGKKLYEGVLDDLQKSYAQAPRESEIQPTSDSSLQIIDVEVDGVAPGKQTSVCLSDREKDGKTFSVENNITYKKTSETITFEDEFGNIQTLGPNNSVNARLQYYRHGYENNLINNSDLYFRANVTEKTVNGEACDEANINITPREARLIVEDLLVKTNCTDFVIDSVMLVSDIAKNIQEDDALLPWEKAGFRTEEKWKEAGSPVNNPKEEHAYQFRLLRSVGGIGIDFDIESTALNDESYDAEWWNEAFYITVDDGGIRDLSWNAPIVVTETIAEDSALLSFTEISEIFEKMFFVKYEAKAAETQKETEYLITKAKLSLQRIREANATATGLVVPVWNFYGYGIYDGRSETAEQIWPKLTINAVDGSIIDIFQGY